MPGQVIVWSGDETTWIAGNVDRDTAGDFLIAMDGNHHLSSADFVVAPLVLDQSFLPYVDGRVATLHSR